MSNQGMAAAGAGGSILALGILIAALILGTLLWQGYRAVSFQQNQPANSR